MKKVLCIVLALMCLCGSALAESVPSKNTSDMVVVEVSPELNPNVPADSGLVVMPVQEEDEAQAEEYVERTELCRNEIAKLAEAVASTTEGSGAETYFGEVKDGQGNPVVLSEAFEGKQLNVFEFMPLVVANYDAAYGDLTMNFKFKTPYAKDEKVLVLIGIPNAETGEMEWTSFEGVVTGEEGAVQVQFTSEILLAIQNSNALLAVVSAEETESQQ
jgi:hypothetical protein